MERSEILRLFESLDRREVEPFADRFGAQGRYRVGNEPAAVGAAAIARSLHDFFGFLEGVKHELSGLWPIPDGWVVEALVDYRVRGGEQVYVASAIILRTTSEHALDDVRVFADLAPVFAAAQAAALPKPTDSEPLGDVVHRASAHKGAFVIEQAGELRAELTYSRAGDLLILDHTWVDDRARGLGLGVRLVEAAVAFVRAEGTRLMPLCPFARSVFARRAELRDVLA